jgi:putative membrane protein
MKMATTRSDANLLSGQVLALFIGVLPFALVEEMGWYTVLMVSLVCFTLYGWFSHNKDGNNPFGC